VTGVAVTLTGLFVYPLKSAAGVALPRCRVGARGLELDRRWMVVDDRGEFQTQRLCPRLALVRVALAGDSAALSAPGMPELVLDRPEGSAGRRPVRIWRDTVMAAPLGAGPAAWMSEHLGVACEVVYLPGDATRVVEEGYQPRRQVSFADGFPFLLLSEASLADLNARLERPMPMNRFRPNLVVTGCAPFAEDSWREVRIGALRFAVVKPCARCVITTTDQATGERGREPLATLASYRRRGDTVLFGQNLIHLDEGWLAVGDAVSVTDPA